jgi:hypothetical protein
MASDGRRADPGGFASDSSWGSASLVDDHCPCYFGVLASESKSRMVDRNLARSLGQLQQPLRDIAISFPRLDSVTKYTWGSKYDSWALVYVV